MSENTTSINELPTDPVTGGSISGSMQMSTPDPSNHISLDQSTISQIVNGLQQASLTGATQLPSKDIPMMTEQITHDAHVNPNYVPRSNNVDYITTENNNDINAYYKYESQNDALDKFYDEIQNPLLLAILYFIFQLPIFKKNMFVYLPFLCNNDGNYNLQGYLFTSALFGFLFYSLNKFLKYFSV